MPDPQDSQIPLEHRPPSRPVLTLVRASILLAAVALLAGGWYARTYGLTKKWRGIVAREFERRGIHLSLGRLTLDPLEGLIARDVKIYEDARRDVPIAAVSRVALSIDLGALLRKENFLDVVDLREATLTIPFRPSGAAPYTLAITDLYARAQIEHGQIRVGHARARLHRFQIAASGTLLSAPARAPAGGGDRARGAAGARQAPRAPDSVDPPHPFLSSLLDTLARIDCPPQVPPRIEIEFDAELSRPERAQVQVTLSGRDLRLGGYHLRAIDVEAILQESRVELRRCALEDDEGRLVARGVYHSREGDLRLQMQSGIDLQALARELSPPDPGAPPRPTPDLALLQEFVFYPIPRIEASIEADLRGDRRHTRAQGSFQTDKAIFRNLVLEKIRGDFSWDGRSLFLDQLALEHRTGKLRARLLSRPGEFRASVESSINPNILRPLLRGRTRESLEQWTFLDSPDLSLEMEGERPDFSALRGTGKIRLGRTLYRGVGVNSATSNLSWEAGALTCDELWLERDEGFATGTLVYDFRNSEVRMTNLISTLNPHETCVWASPNLARDLRDLEFDRPPSLTFNGTVRSGRGHGSDLRIDFRAPDGLRYRLCDRWLPLEGAQAQLSLDATTFRVGALRAGLFGGGVEADVSFDITPGKRGYSSSIRLDEVNFAKLTRLYFDYDDSHGELSATYKLSGDSASPRSVVGAGRAVVLEGNIFAIPVLGPLSKLLNEILPGIGFSPARKASVTWETRDGRIHTRDFEVQGVGFTMLGEGWIDCVDDRMDFNMRVNARGVPGVLLFPVSKLFEYTCDRSFSQPNWHPKRIPLPGGAPPTPQRPPPARDLAAPQPQPPQDRR